MSDWQEHSIAVPHTCRFNKLLLQLIATFFAILLAIYYADNFPKEHFQYIQIIAKNFARNYRYSYNEIVYGRVDYCNRNQLVNISTIFAKFEQLNVLHHKSALQQLRRSLANDTDFNAIALVGGVGVGKSLVVRAITESFPWPDNVHTYAWNTHVNNDDEKFNLLHLIIDQLSDCGYNLMVIENLRAKDYSLVDVLNKRIAATVCGSKRVIVIYVFSLNTMIGANNIVKQRKLIYENLPNTTIITFESFNKNKLKACILRETLLENVSLSSDDFNEIHDAIDPYYSGCKNVKAKVLLYGTTKTKPLV